MADVQVIPVPRLVAWLEAIEAQHIIAGRHAEARGVRSVILRIKFKPAKGDTDALTIAAQALTHSLDNDARQAERLVAHLEAQNEVHSTRAALLQIRRVLDEALPPEVTA